MSKRQSPRIAGEPPEIAQQSIALRPWMVAALIALATFIAYWPAISQGGFIWDDDSYVTNNHLLRDVDGLRRIWFEPRATPQYYPAVFTSFWIEHQLWALDPTGYRVVNVLLHALNAILVWRLCLMLRLPGGGIAAALIAAAFALHPVHVESVAWITERKNVLSGFFYLAAALCYLRFDAQLDQHESGAGWGFYGLSLALFTLALLSKTVTCSLPAALILMMLWLRKPLTLRRLAPLTPFFVLGLVLALHTAHLERQHVGAEGEDFAFSFAQRLLIASNALLFYPSKLLWPHPIIFVYPRWEIDATSVASYWPLELVTLTGAACLIAYLRGVRGPFLTLAFFAGTVFPALGFFNVYPMLFSFVADHFQYLASLGVIALVVSGLIWLTNRPVPVAIVIGATLPVLAAITYRQAGVYQSAETVWLDTLEKNDEAWMPHNNMASLLASRAGELAQRGQVEQSKHIAEQALRHAQRALELKPDHRPALTNQAESLRLLGRYDEALPIAQRALELLRAKQLAQVEARAIKNPRLPHLASAQWQVGRLHELLGQDEQALAHYNKALEWDPTDLLVRTETARLLVKLNRLDQAVAHYEIIVQFKPDDVNSLAFLGEMAERAGRCGEAESLYLRALAAAETHRSQQEFLHAGYKLARLWTTCADHAHRNAAQAMQLAEELAAVTSRTSPYILGVLADAYAQTGRIDDAIRTVDEAIALSNQLGLSDLANELAPRAAAYRSHPHDGTPMGEQ